MPKDGSLNKLPVRRTRRNRSHDVTRAAVEVFFQHGYETSSVQDVADAVGASKGSLYYYIDSKEDLLFKIVEDVYAQSSAILADVLALDVSSIERLREYIERHVKWYLANVEEATVYFRERRSLSGERFELDNKRRRTHERVVRRLIVDAQSEGDIDAGVDAKYASFFILSAVNTVPEWFRRRSGDSASRIAASYADMTVGTLVGTRPRASGETKRKRRKAA